MIFLFILCMPSWANQKHQVLSHQVLFKFEEHVAVLDLDNFDAALMRFEVLLVEFYAPWCPHCKNLKPKFEEAAKQLKDNSITLGKVDCTVESELCQRFHITGYPTLRIFYHNNIFHYNGGRSSSDIVDYMVKHLNEQKKIEENRQNEYD